MDFKEKLVLYAKNNLNVMFVGPHGVGKTTVARQVIEDELKLKYKYYSSSTLDPWADLVGIPVPDKKTKTSDFYRPQDLENAEAIFFDELNRAHPRVLNAVLEIVQFKTINGQPLPNLKFVWCAVNPPGGDYQVEDMDPALIDRFHCYIRMEPEINIEYMQTKFSKKIATCLSEWWNQDLEANQQSILTPRRIEYIGTLIDKGIPWKDSIPQGHTFPIHSLDERLNLLSDDKKNPLKISKENILNNKDKFLDALKENVSIGIKIKKVINEQFDGNELFEIRDILEFMPKEWMASIKEKRLPIFSDAFKEKFKDNKINYKKLYPKISDIFGF